MTLIGWIQIFVYCAIVVALVKPLGWYMTRVFNGERTFLSPVLRPVEAALYWAGGVDEKLRSVPPGHFPASSTVLWASCQCSFCRLGSGNVAMCAAASETELMLMCGLVPPA